MEINMRIKEIRLQKEMSQQAFANLLGVSRAYVKNIENGQLPSFNFLLALTIPTKISIDWVLTGEGNMYRRVDEAESKHEDIEELLNCLRKYWENASSKEKAWMEIQLKRTFPECDK